MRTAAAMLIRKSTFRSNLTSYLRCGEDVQLNLDLREKLKGRVMLCPHGGVALKVTRAENHEAGNNSRHCENETRRRLFSIMPRRNITSGTLNERRAHLYQTGDGKRTQSLTCNKPRPKI